jgi:hypothetical protein
LCGILCGIVKLLAAFRHNASPARGRCPKDGGGFYTILTYYVSNEGDNHI